MMIHRRLSISKWILFAFGVSILIVVPASEAGAGNWFKSAFKKKSTGPVSYAETLADACYAPKTVSVTPLAVLPGADANKIPVIYTQKNPEAFNIAISPDGKHIVTSDNKGNVSLWEKASGRLVWNALVHPRGMLGALDLAFSPDGRKLFSLGRDQQGILVLDPTSGKVVDRLPFGTCEFPGKKGQVFSAQGTVALVNVGWGKSILVELATRKKVKEFKGTAVAISPSGHRIATTVSVWDACSGRQQKWAFKEEDVDINSKGAFSPDGSRLALWTSHQLVLLDTASGKQLWEGPRARTGLGGFGPQCMQLFFSGDGHHLFFHGSYPPLTRPSPWSILTLDAWEGKPVKVFADNWMGMGGGFAVTPDGRNIVIGFDPGIVFLDEKTLATVLTIQGHTKFFPFSVNARGAIVTPFHQWDPQTAQPVKTFGLPEELVFAQVGLSPDGNILTAITQDPKMTESRVIRWDARSGKVLEEVAIPAPKTKSGVINFLGIEYSPGGQYIALACDIERKVIYDIQTGRQISVIQHLTMTGISEFSGDDKFIAASHSQTTPPQSSIGIWDIRSGKMVREFDPKKITAHFSVSGMAFSPGNGMLLVTGYDYEKGYGRALLDTRTGDIIWKHIDPTGRGQQEHLYRAEVSPDGKTALVFRADGYLSLVDQASGRILREFEGGFAGLGGGWYTFSPDSSRIYGSQYSGELKIWDTRTGKHLATIMEFPGGEWLSMTPDGYYASSEKAGQYLNVRVGLHVQGVDQYYEVFYRPDLVADNLKRDTTAPADKPETKKNLLQVAAIGTPPRVLFRFPADKVTISKRDVEVAVELINTGGGIGKVEWKINGVTVGITEDASRGLAIVAAGKKAGIGVPVKRLLTLSPGENVIQVTASNTTNEITSIPAILNLTCQDEISDNPSLYLLTVGINKYRDGSLRLNYSVPDAQSVSKTLGVHSKTIFEKIVIEQVFDEKATLEGIQAAFDKISCQVQTQDVFVFYVAGHGVTQAGRFHLLPYDFRYRNEKSIRKKGITQDHIQKWLASIQARKSLILMDTCNSGAFTRAKAVQRGIADKTAINRLTRATGRAIIVAAKDDQPAMEGYKGHGVFTYVLLSAFKEADQAFGNRDGQTSIFELAAYIDEHVPEITYRQFGYEQVPQVNMQGRDFPIATAP